jgi:endonuclease/exonuclease/phosphatase family metal-dependent hydrolase
MKIATWNLERPQKNEKKNAEIIKILKGLDADIIILTEANECIDLGVEYEYYMTEVPYSVPGKVVYKEGERRVIICVAKKYESKQMEYTYDPQTTICIEVEIESKHLAVYGTIIGIYGNKGDEFKKHLAEQIKEFKKIAAEMPLCIAGDYNMSFGDNYYKTEVERNILIDTFRKLELYNLTASIPENIDHIALSKSFVKNRSIKASSFNIDKDGNINKKLSDHRGVIVDIS